VSNTLKETKLFTVFFKLELRQICTAMGFSEMTANGVREQLLLNVSVQK